MGANVCGRREQRTRLVIGDGGGGGGTDVPGCELGWREGDVTGAGGGAGGCVHDTGA